MRSKIFVSSLTNLSFVLIALFAFVFEIVFFVPEARAAMGFACGMSSVMDADSNLYSTVTIGSQCWLKENMMTTKYPDGAAITRGPATATWDATDHTYYAYPPNVAGTAEESLANIQSGKLGFVYQWSAAMHGSTTSGAQGICPSGWHVPTHDEFTTLERAVCTSGTCATDFPFDTTATGWRGTNEGSKLSTETSGGTNSTGFTGHLAGYRDITGGFFNHSSVATFWSSSEFMSSFGWARSLSAEQQKVERIPAYKLNAFSVRCVYNTPLLVNGSCGSANGTTVSSAPASNLCATGTASAVTGAGAWSWSCLGLGGGSTAVCGANTSNFTCGTSTVQDIDVNLYSTVTIGSQCWLKENMMTTKYPDGAAITRGPATATWDATDHTYYAYPPNVAGTAEESLANIQSGKLGFVYQWSAAMHGSTTSGAQGICPSGWHVPTHDEFTTLERAVCTSGTCATDFPFDTITSGAGRGTNEGSKLSNETPGGDNSSGFTAHLNGYRYVSGLFYNRLLNVVFWSSSPSGVSAWYRYLNSSNATVARAPGSKAFGFSVRCLKVGNNCAANTCVGQTCDNGINPLTPGTKAPTFSSYNCAETDAAINAFCAVSSNCGLNITTTSADFACTAANSCTGSLSESRPTAECTAQSIPCPSVPKTIQCPGCPLRIKQGGFTEVKP